MYRNEIYSYSLHFTVCLPFALAVTFMVSLLTKANPLVS